MQLVEPTDLELLDRARRGCETSWTALYRRHQGRIYRYALRMCGSAALAEETVQETFLALLDQMDRYDGSRGVLGAWLVGVARNKLLKILASEPVHSEIEPEIHAQPGSLLEDLTQAQAHRQVHQAVLSLPANYREVVVLCDLEEMDYAETAKLLDCPVGTVRSRLHRARHLLMDRLIPVEQKGVTR